MSYLSLFSACEWELSSKYWINIQLVPTTLKVLLPPPRFHLGSFCLLEIGGCSNVETILLELSHFLYRNEKDIKVIDRLDKVRSVLIYWNQQPGLSQNISIWTLAVKEGWGVVRFVGHLLYLKVHQGPFWRSAFSLHLG